MEFLLFNHKSLVFFTTHFVSDEKQLVLPRGREALEWPLSPMLRSPIRNVPCLNVSSFVCLSTIAWLTLAKWNLMKEKGDSSPSTFFLLLFCFLGPQHTFSQVSGISFKNSFGTIFVAYLKVKALWTLLGFAKTFIKKKFYKMVKFVV